MRRLLALALVGCLALAGCDGSASPAPTPRAGPSARPSYPVPGSPPAGVNPDRIRSEIQPLMGESGLYFGDGANGVVVIGLRANAEAIARQLVEKYGTAIEVTLGLFPYPPPEGVHGLCPQLPQAGQDHRPLVATLTAQPTVAGGAFFDGKVRITNAGPAPYDLTTSSGFPIYLFRPGETLPIGVPEGATAGTGYGKTLGVGEAVELPAGGGTASCDLSVGYVLPAGNYQARALVDFQEPVTFTNKSFWTDAMPIRVVDP